MYSNSNSNPYLRLISGVVLACSALFFGVAQAQQVLRVTTIPEEAATEQMRKFGPLTKYLERTTGMTERVM